MGRRERLARPLAPRFVRGLAQRRCGPAGSRPRASSAAPPGPIWRSVNLEGSARNACPSCGAACLVARRAYRRGSLSVFLGHLLLLPSLLVVVLGSMGVVSPRAGVELERRASAELASANVPAELAARVRAREPVPASELDALTVEQRQGVLEAQLSAASGSARASMGAVHSSSAFRWGAGLALLGLATGALLVQKRRVDCCSSCGAVAG